VGRVAPRMDATQVASTLWSYATLGVTPGAAAEAALEAAVLRVGPMMVPQALSITLASYATLGRAPGAEARAALHVGPGRCCSPPHVIGCHFTLNRRGSTCVSMTH